MRVLVALLLCFGGAARCLPHGRSPGNDSAEASDLVSDLVSDPASDPVSDPVSDPQDQVCNQIARTMWDLTHGSADPNSTEAMDAVGDLDSTEAKMKAMYVSAKVCPYRKQDCDLSREGLDATEVREAMASSRDFDELAYTWSQWHDATGRKLRPLYRDYVEQSNAAAWGANVAEDWKAQFGMENLEAAVDALWEKVEPLYKELHLFTLRRLRAAYPGRIQDDAHLIPGHILGGIHGYFWDTLYDIVVPYPEASSFDITRSLQEQNFTVLRMFEMADDFYKSMGLLSSEMSYGEKAMIEKPDDLTVDCHPASWDFCDGQDFRVSMCAKVNQLFFYVIHHELGHIQYYQQYAHLPVESREAANPGFSEAVGDTIALSVKTSKHLEAMGLLEDHVDSRESRLNDLMKAALTNIPTLAFALVADKWRWAVFAGQVDESRWNEHWWDLKAEYQLLSPPVPRSEDDFDPGAVYHVAVDYPFISYFVAQILQFQFYRALCIEAGQYDPSDPNGSPLHVCDFYNNTDAGDRFASGLSLGASVHWTEALEAITNSTEMSSDALLEYFAPLLQFLKEDNANHSNSGETPSTCSASMLSAAVDTLLAASALTFLLLFLAVLRLVC